MVLMNPPNALTVLGITYRWKVVEVGSLNSCVIEIMIKAFYETISFGS